MAATFSDRSLFEEAERIADLVPHRDVEIEDGTIIVAPKPLPYHQRVMLHLGYHLEARLDPETFVVLPEVDWRLSDDTEKAPDIGVWRLADVSESRPQFEPPALVAEILSPSNRDPASLARRYLDAGAPTVWLLDPEAQLVTEHGRLRPGWLDGFTWPRRLH